EYIHIKIEKLPDMGENFRKISINGYGDRYNYIKEIKEC
ncbi:MAG: tRNA (adenosine(37)-N6)-threonylcarbamoyltransferase complex ATPase subunit type 1 TsaE, partial [Clostridium perfringens]